MTALEKIAKLEQALRWRTVIEVEADPCRDPDADLYDAVDARMARLYPWLSEPVQPAWLCPITRMPCMAGREGS